VTTQHHSILIVGGGSAGITVAALLCDRGASGIDPRDVWLGASLAAVAGGVRARQ